MANDFFEKKEEKEEMEEKQENAEKVKIGESEFAPEELEILVESGKRLKEIEEKQGQPVEDILKSWGQRGEVLGKYKKLTGTETVEELGSIKSLPAPKPLKNLRKGWQGKLRRLEERLMSLTRKNLRKRL